MHPTTLSGSAHVALKLCSPVLPCLTPPFSLLSKLAGGGACAYTSIATGLAKLARTDAKPCDLKPGGRLQGYLRCEAAKWVRGHADMFGGPEAASSFATKVHHWGVGRHPFPFSLGQSPQSAAQPLVGDDPPASPAKKPKRENKGPAVVWLQHLDNHYCWLQPSGNDPRVEDAVLSTAVKVDASTMAASLVGGGKRSVATSARRRLGLSSVKSSSANDAWQLLGLGSVSSASLSSAELLGLDKAGESTSLCDQPYTAGQLYTCKCGWTVPAGLYSNRAHAAAVSHWRHCQGTTPPTADAQSVRRRVAFGAVAKSEHRRERAWEAYQAHLSKLKAAKWQDAACVPIRDGLATKVQRSGACDTVYPCSKCRRVQTLTRLRSLPCPARDPKHKITRHAWIAKTVGVEAAAHFKSKERLGHNKFMASAKGKLAQQRANARRGPPRGVKAKPSQS